MRGQIILQAPVAPPSSLLWVSVSSPDINVGIRLTKTAITIAKAHRDFLTVGRFPRTRNLHKAEVTMVFDKLYVYIIYIIIY